MNTAALVSILPTLLMLSSLAVMASRTLTPIRAKLEGKVEYELSLGLVQRVLSQKINILAICFLVALGGGALGNTPWLGGGLGYIALAVMLALVLVPQRVVFTSAGIMPTRAIFRPWSDFSSCDVSGRRVRLHGPSQLSSLRLIASSATLGDVERVIGRHVGRPARATRPAARSRRRQRTA
ncbi:MAG: hypothetical protein WCB85_05700 [Candidatus Dormiibacterota bacterium]